MDWSDDVAYSVHDVEDAIASGWIDPRLLHSRDMADVIDVAGRTYAPDLGADALGAALERVLASGVVPTAYDGSRGDLARLKDMTSRLIGHFVLVVEMATRERHGPGELCRFEADLVVPDDTRAECSVLKAIANHFVMTTDERLAIMAAPARRRARRSSRRMPPHPSERLDAAFRADHDAAADDGERLRVVVDQVASLTDVRALALHSQWCRVTSGRHWRAPRITGSERRQMAGLINGEDIATVKARSSIEDVVREHVTLRPAGARLAQGPVPLPRREDARPSTSAPPWASATASAAARAATSSRSCRRSTHLTFTEAVERLAAQARRGAALRGGRRPRDGAALGPARRG